MADSVTSQINKVNKQLNDLADGLTKDVQKNKALKRKASRSLEAAMYLNAPKSKNTVLRNGKTIRPGALKRSIKILPLRKSYDIFVGSDFRIAPHAHLVEFGFNHHNGKFVNGSHFVEKSYNQTKDIVLAELVKLATKEFEKWGKKLEVSG